MSANKSDVNKPFIDLISDLREASSAFATDAVTAKARGKQIRFDIESVEELAKLLQLAAAAVSLLIGEEGGAA